MGLISFACWRRRMPEVDICIYCKSLCMINTWSWACSAVLSLLGFESGWIFVWKCGVEGKQSEEEGSSVYWKIYMMTQTIMRRIHNRAKMAPYDLFWMFLLAKQEQRRESEREREMTEVYWGWKQNMKRLLLLLRSFSTSGDSRAGKKQAEKNERSKRGKVLVKHLRERMEAKGEQEVEKVIQRELKKRSKRACGCMTSVVFHLCVVDVLINSVRFSFWRLHGVFHADSGGYTRVANRTERRLISSPSFA